MRHYEIYIMSQFAPQNMGKVFSIWISSEFSAVMSCLFFLPTSEHSAPIQSLLPLPYHPCSHPMAVELPPHSGEVCVYTGSPQKKPQTFTLLPQHSLFLWEVVCPTLRLGDVCLVGSASLHPGHFTGTANLPLVPPSCPNPSSHFQTTFRTQPPLLS